MIRPIAFLAALAGLALSLIALVVEGTGVTETPGAGLAVLGCLATLVGLLLLTSRRLSRGLWILIALLTALAAALTALAGWFLMQNSLAAVMAVACLATLGVAANPRSLRRT